MQHCVLHTQFCFHSFVQVNVLLPSSMFLSVVRGLLDHKLPTVRRKAMELLNTRLQHQGSLFSSGNREGLFSLLTPLMALMGGTGDVAVRPDLDTNQQVAMISVKLLARYLAPENPSHFKEVNCYLSSLLIQMTAVAVLRVSAKCPLLHYFKLLHWHYFETLMYLSFCQ